MQVRPVGQAGRFGSGPVPAAEKRQELSMINRFCFLKKRVRISFDSYPFDAIYGFRGTDTPVRLSETFSDTPGKVSMLLPLENTVCPFRNESISRTGTAKAAVNLILQHP